MIKIKLFFVTLTIFIIGFSACSKKTGIDKIYGNWKVVDFDNPQMKSMNVEITYEFKKDTMISTASVNGEKQPTQRIPYIVKPPSSDTIILEATHPNFHVKGDFKIVFNESKMILKDPGNETFTLEKQ